MTTYYYLVASLPSLGAADAPRPTSAVFRALCSEHLLPADLAEFDLVLSGAGGSGFARRWREADATIRNQCARTRAARLGVDVQPHLRSVKSLDLTLEHRTREALAAGDPGERERRLDALRREVLRELAFDSPFGLPAVLAYGIELRILERQAARDTGRGRDGLSRRIESLLGGNPSPSEQS
ncbi:MAG: DUF2764 family protein [Planctomycetota bacterium]